MSIFFNAFNTQRRLCDPQGLAAATSGWRWPPVYCPMKVLVYCCCKDIYATFFDIKIMLCEFFQHYYYLPWHLILEPYLESKTVSSWLSF